MAPASASATFANPCHNCRRRRLRCDRSRPECHKCAAAGRECLGYDRVFTWAGGVAIRGKMSGRSFGEVVRTSGQGPLDAMSAAGFPGGMDMGTPTLALTDPAFQDLSYTSRVYLEHCKHKPKNNPARPGGGGE